MGCILTLLWYNKPMTEIELATHEKTKGLHPDMFKAYCLLKAKAVNGQIEKFTIRGLAREWQENKELNMPSSKNRVKAILRDLEEKGLIENNIKTDILLILL